MLIVKGKTELKKGLFDIFRNLRKDYKEFMESDSSILNNADACIAATEEEQKLFDNYEEFLINSKCYINELTSWHLNLLQNFINHTKEMTHTRKIGTVLDYGAGIGTRSAVHAVNGWKTLLVDLNLLSLNFAQWRFSKYKLGGEFEQRIKLPEWSNTCDEILLFDVIGHLSNPKKSLQEMGICAKSGCILHITWDNWFDSEDGHVHRNKEFDFKGMLNSVGFVEKSEELWIKK